MIEVCPLPGYWAKLYTKLCDAARALGRDDQNPPMPYMLGSWIASDVAKRERWLRTIAWAEARGLRAIIDELTPDMMHRVERMSTTSLDPYAGWDLTTKSRPPEDEVDRALFRLQADWAEIAGPALAAATRPLRFTGPKRRRLVVYADPAASAPWGRWDALAGPDAKSFTRFRAAVNAAIHPHEVDHIDFVHADERKDR